MNDPHNSLNHLKKHKFFQNQDFEKLDKMTPPQKKIYNIKKTSISTDELSPLPTKQSNKEEATLKNKDSSIVKNENDARSDEAIPKCLKKSFDDDKVLQAKCKRIKFFLIEFSGKLTLYQSGKLEFVRQRNDDKRVFTETNIVKLEFKGNFVSVWISKEKKYQFKLMEGGIKEWETELKKLFPKQFFKP